jgi:YVTN family beta-propeller protein
VTTPTGLLRIDPKTNAVAATIKVPVSAGDPDVIDGKVWLPVANLNEVIVIDPATNAVVARTRVGTGPFVVTAIGGQAWVPSYKGADIYRLKP